MSGDAKLQRLFIVPFKLNHYHARSLDWSENASTLAFRPELCMYEAPKNFSTLHLLHFRLEIRLSDYRSTRQSWRQRLSIA